MCFSCGVPLPLSPTFAIAIVISIVAVIISVVVIAIVVSAIAIAITIYVVAIVITFEVSTVATANPSSYNDLAHDATSTVARVSSNYLTPHSLELVGLATAGPTGPMA